MQAFHGRVAGRVHQNRAAPIVADCAAVRFRRQVSAVQILRQREGLAEPATPILDFILIVEFAHLKVSSPRLACPHGLSPFMAFMVRTWPQLEQVTSPLSLARSDAWTLNRIAPHLGQCSWTVSGRPAEPVAGSNDGWPSQFRFAGDVLVSGMAQLRMLGAI